MRIPTGLLWVLGVAIPAACVFLTGPWHSPDAPATPPAEASSEPEKSDFPTNNSQTLKKTYGTGEDDLRTVVYRLGGQGNPRTCDIFDAKGTRLLKASFGYNRRPGKSFGNLAEVWIFDAREPAIAPKTKATPLRCIVLSSNPDGKITEPRVIDLVPSDVINTILGPALLAFNPIADLEALRSPAGFIPDPKVAR